MRSLLGASLAAAVAIAPGADAFQVGVVETIDP